MEREIPQWFKDSDFGIFVHYGLYSIPSFAVTGEPPKGERSPFKCTKYAEWYANSIKIPDSPARRYHTETYGDNFAYEDFVPELNRYVNALDVEKWAETFSRVGAKYVVFVAKHHDGFCMWNTAVKNSKTNGNYCTERDFIGELAAAVRARGMRFGIYYSSLLDWTFVKTPIIKRFDIRGLVDDSEEYCEYVYRQWKELIDRYHPDVLWSDIGYPAGDKRLFSLFDYYRAAVPHGVINDRWTCFPKWLIGDKTILQNIFHRVCLNQSKRKRGIYFDYRTTEYREMNSEPTYYWEMCRGIDLSFGYNKFSAPENYLSGKEVVALIARVNARKGRLLLNVGPMGNGEIPEYQRKTLDEIAELRGDSNRNSLLYQ